MLINLQILPSLYIKISNNNEFLFSILQEFKCTNPNEVRYDQEPFPAEVQDHRDSSLFEVTIYCIRRRCNGKGNSIKVQYNCKNTNTSYKINSSLLILSKVIYLIIS